MDKTLSIYIADTNKLTKNGIIPKCKKNKNSLNTNKFVYALLEHAIKHTFEVNNLNDLRKNENGKPISDRFYLSISHKNNLIAVALSSQNVGVDIEQVSSKINIQNILKTISHNVEKSLDLKTIDDVIKLWVKKESKFKFDGEKKFIPNQINTLNYNFYIEEFNNDTKKYYLSVYAEDYENLSIQYLI